jgi:uncharacterized protein (TIGR03435 family)
MNHRSCPRVSPAIHLVIGGMLLATAGEAQESGNAAPRNFEVASVKANYSDGRGSFEISTAGDRLSVRNTYLGVIIMRAYNIDESQFTASTPQLLRTRFDIEAKADHSVSRNDMMLMLQSLLVERFKLRFHRETQEVSGYALVLAKREPKLRQHDGASPSDCKHRMDSDGQLIFENCPLSDLVGTNVLYSMLGRRFVADETGLTGTYDFELMASWELPANPREGTQEPRVINAGAPSIFTAIERQLGMKLEPKRIPVHFFTIEHIDKPSEN